MSFLSRKPARPEGRGRADQYDDYDDYAHDGYQSEDDGWSPNEYFSPEGIKGRWAGAPAGTKSIALVVDDSDAPITPYVYWLVFDIGPGTSALAEGQLPPGARQAKGTAGYERYDPPCPGSGGHSYRFTVYALNRALNLPNGTSLQSAWQAVAAATIGRGRLTVSATS